jgi:predicted transcriptional regulator
LCVIDKETGNNAYDIVGAEKGNINRTLVLLKALKLIKDYPGNRFLEIKLALWKSLYAQMKKMIKQKEISKAIKIATNLLFRVHWKLMS